MLLYVQCVHSVVAVHVTLIEMHMVSTHSVVTVAKMAGALLLLKQKSKQLEFTQRIEPCTLKTLNS